METKPDNTENLNGYNNALDAALKYLEQHQTEGFWSYLPGNDWCLEASVWAALAARKRDGCLFAFTERLISEQNSDGGWSNEPAKRESDWSTAAALFALQYVKWKSSKPHPSARKLDTYLSSSLFEKAYDWLMENRAEYYSSAAKFALLVWKGPEYDYERGWPWTSETFDWVEPTSYALLGLKKSRFSLQPKCARATELAEEFLLKLVCNDGGWNFGDRNPYGKSNPADIQTSSLALLALKDKAENPKVKKSIGWLQQINKKSAMQLSWTALALSTHGKKCRDISQQLLSLQSSDGAFSKNLLTHAIATLAIQSDIQNESIF